MPLLWRYLLFQHLKVFFLCLTTFVAILLTTRLDEIAHFATLGPEGLYILLFTLYQIPYILPIAIPISSLISAIILIQKLSSTHELTAMRAAGLALRQILFPILLCASLLTVANFYIVSELATASHLSSSLLKNEMRAVNPLLLLHNKHLLRMKGIFFDSLGPSKIGESLTHVVLALPKKTNGRIHLVVAEKLLATPLMFSGTKLTFISPFKNDQNTFDQLVVENSGKTTTTIQDFSQLLQKKVWVVNNDYLNLPMLLVRLQKEKQAYSMGVTENKSTNDLKQLQRNINRCRTEIIRRLSLALAVFSFTFMGASFGISISRNRSYKGLFFVVSSVIMYLMTFFAAKNIDQLLVASSLLYLVPHLLIVGSSIWMLNRVTRGIE